MVPFDTERLERYSLLPWSCYTSRLRLVLTADRYIQGLLQSEYYAVVNSMLQNFMDQLEKFGFIPNGGRIYYLNRSQPPVFSKVSDPAN